MQEEEIEKLFLSAFPNVEIFRMDSVIAGNGHLWVSPYPGDTVGIHYTKGLIYIDCCIVNLKERKCDFKTLFSTNNVENLDTDFIVKILRNYINIA